jgi:hypothetical protein
MKVGMKAESRKGMKGRGEGGEKEGNKPERIEDGEEDTEDGNEGNKVIDEREEEMIDDGFLGEAENEDRQ